MKNKRGALLALLINNRLFELPLSPRGGAVTGSWEHLMSTEPGTDGGSHNCLLQTSAASNGGPRWRHRPQVSLRTHVVCAGAANTSARVTHAPRVTAAFKRQKI